MAASSLCYLEFSGVSPRTSCWMGSTRRRVVPSYLATRLGRVAWSLRICKIRKRPARWELVFDDLLGVLGRKLGNSNKPERVKARSGLRCH